jgi:hypothetical protein
MEIIFRSDSLRYPDQTKYWPDVRTNVGHEKHSEQFSIEVKTTVISIFGTRRAVNIHNNTSAVLQLSSLIYPSLILCGSPAVARIEAFSIIMFPLR